MASGYNLLPIWKATTGTGFQSDNDKAIQVYEKWVAEKIAAKEFSLFKPAHLALKEPEGLIIVPSLDESPCEFVGVGGLVACEPFKKHLRYRHRSHNWEQSYFWVEEKFGTQLLMECCEDRVGMCVTFVVGMITGGVGCRGFYMDGTFLTLHLDEVTDE